MKMQRNKDKKTLSEIDTYCNNSSSLVDIFTRLLGEFDLRYINKLLSGSKARGVNGKHIFKTLFLLRFLDFDNIHQLMQSGISKEIAHKKDVFYDFQNNHRVNWRNILKLFFKQACLIISSKSISDNSKDSKYLIIDDTLLEKSGKKIELIGKVFDHSTHLYRLGMKVLTLGYSDGKSFMPIDFSIHHEPGKTKKRGLKAKDIKAQFSKERAENTPGYKRESEVRQDKITTALQLIKGNAKRWLKVDYVLADTWFICEKFIKGIKHINKNLNIIGLMKMNRMVIIGGKACKANKVPEIKRKNIHYSNKLKCHYISLKFIYKGIEMKGYWIKMKGQNNWNLLVSTNDKLTFIKAMKHYQNRWSIEVFFRDAKQNLGLGDCQSKDLDAHIASISLVFMNYLVLTLKKRFEDYETIGILFRDVKEMMIKQTVVQKIWTILLQLFDSVFAQLGVHWEVFIRTLINSQKQVIEQVCKTFESFFLLKQVELT